MFRIGDRITCKIRGNSIVPSNAGNYDVDLPFYIIGVDEKNAKMIVYIPSCMAIKSAFNIKEEHLVKYNIDPYYLDQKGSSVGPHMVIRAQVTRTGEDGMICNRCKEFFPMAEPNQDDGTMRCYSCRTDPWR